MTLEEIRRRRQQLLDELNNNDNPVTEQRISEIETEIAELETTERSLVAAQNLETRRQNLLNSIASGTAGTVVRSANPAAPTPAAAPAQDREEDPTNSMEYRRAFRDYVQRGIPMPAELRQNQNTTTADAGPAIPMVVLDRIVEELGNYGMILPLVTHTAYKGGVTIPVASAKPVATFVAEGATSEKQKKTVTGNLTFAYHKLRCAISVTLETDTMAIPAFEQMLVRNISEAMAKALEQAIVSGTGTGEPKGIITETPVTGQAIEVTEINYATLISAEAALPQQYENGAVYVMTKKTFMGFIGMVDEAKQPIARVNYGIGGRPERSLLGRPVVLTDYLPNFASATNGKVFAFIFRMEDYMLNTNYAMTVKTYEDNDTEDKITKAVMLVDGKVVDKGSLVALKKKTT